MISLQDLRFALRSLAKVPGFTFAVIATLALGIGANTAIYSVVRGALLRPLPNRDGERLVYLRQSAKLVGTEQRPVLRPRDRRLPNGRDGAEGIR